MRDLYRHIKLSRSATPEQIKGRLAVPAIRDSTAGKAAAEILLDPNRRAQYDRVHHAVARITSLRVHTSTIQVGYGRSGVYNDFLPAETSTRGADPAAAKSGVARPKPGSLRNDGCFVIMLVILGFGALAAFLSQYTRSDSFPAPRSSPSQHRPAPTSAPTVPAPQPVAMPQTGYGDRSSSSTNNAITVTTRGDRNTLVKIENLQGHLITTGFIRAGGSHRFLLPLGTYRVKTATGMVWYGDQHLFGRDTSYSIADDTFPLNQPGEYWEVTLIPQRQGNLSEKRISAADF